MLLESYQNKKIRLVRKDGWVKFGRVVSIDVLFLRLRFDDGREESIAISEIAQVTEERGVRA